MLTLARPALAEPWQARASGKPIAFIGAQVHGDEPAGKEGLMLFARDVAFGPLRSLLDHLVLVMVPQINPDGAETEPWGQRRNIAGWDLNRDYLRLENPEARAVVEQGVVRWRPHVTIDAHEASGPPRAYDFYTQHADDISGPQTTATLARDGLTPAIVQAIRDAGYTYYPYHILGDFASLREEGIQLGLYDGRNLRGHGGVHGALSVLLESLRGRDARVGIEKRARIQRIAMEAAVRWVTDHADEVVAAVEEGREEMRRLGGRLDSTGFTSSTRPRLRSVSSRSVPLWARNDSCPRSAGVQVCSCPECCTTRSTLSPQSCTAAC